MKFIETFDKFLLSRENWERRSHYASDATNCRRALVYRWRNVPESDPATAGNVLKMRFGTATEGIVKDGLDWMIKQGEIKGYSEQERYEVAVPGLSRPVVMKLDFLLAMADGSPAVLEVKSGYGRGIKEIQRSGRPKDDHLFQVFLYLNYSPAKQAIVVYFGRDNGYRTEFAMWITEDGKMILDGKQIGTVQAGIEWLTKRLAVVERALEDGTLPERDYLHAVKEGQLRDSFTKNKVEYKGDWNCNYCAHQSLCWADVIEATRAGGDNAEMFKEAKK